MWCRRRAQAALDARLAMSPTAPDRVLDGFRRVHRETARLAQTSGSLSPAVSGPADEST
jgi:hypothetical protein